MNRQPIFQGAYWRRFSNASVFLPATDNTGQNVQLGGNVPCSLRLESNDLAMGTLTYSVVSFPMSTGRTPAESYVVSADNFSTVVNTTVPKGSTVRIVATPTSSRYVLDHFEDASGNRLNSQTRLIEVTVNAATTVRAVFRPVNEQTYVTLNVSYDHAKGAVTASPALANDQVTVPFGASVVLTATPAQGYAFKQWRNVLNGGGTDHTVTTEPVHTEQMKVGSKTIYADFVKVAATPTDPGTGQTQQTVTVKWDGKMGKVTGHGLKMDTLKDTGVVKAATGDTITLKAVPKTGYRFVKWAGGPVNNRTDAEVTFAVNADYALYAQFAADNGGGGGGGGDTPPGGGGGGNTPTDPTVTNGGDTTGKVMAFVKKWWWALLIGAYLVYDATKGGRK